MPFNQPVPRSFVASTVRSYAPALSGVYGISNATEWIFIGETDNIQVALLTHLRDLNTAMLKRLPTGFIFEVCDGVTRAERQGRLVMEYKPTCNGRTLRTQ